MELYTLEMLDWYEACRGPTAHKIVASRTGALLPLSTVGGQKVYERQCGTRCVRLRQMLNSLFHQGFVFHGRISRSKVQQFFGCVCTCQYVSAMEAGSSTSSFGTISSCMCL